MNSRRSSDNSQRAASSFNNHEFDFGLGPGFSRSSSGSGSLNAQKQQNAPHNAHAGVGSGSGWASGGGGASWAHKPHSSSVSSSSWTWSSSSTTSSSSSSSSAAAWSWQGSSGSSSLHAPPRSMVGDISGKSWGSMDTISKDSIGKSGLVGGLSRGASADLFGDLLGVARSQSSLPNSKPQQQTAQSYKSPTLSNFDAMASSLPKGTPMKDIKAAKAYQTEEMGDFVSAGSTTKASSQADGGWAAFESISSKSKSGYSDQPKMSQKPSQNSSSEDPFGEFQSVLSGKPSSASKDADPFAGSLKVNTDVFSNMSKSSVPSSNDFFNFAPSTASSAKLQTPKRADTSSFSNSIDLDPFAFINSSKTSASQLPNAQRVESDPFESVLGNISNASTRQKPEDPIMESMWGSTKLQTNVGMQNVTNLDDWGIESGFSEADHAATTTELDGLPPPPPGVSATLSKDKGLEFYKQGQFADAIKWLSWAEILLHQNGETSQIIEVLTCRSSCLKETGDYKKAVADCSKVVDLDDKNTAILLQRALLYESMEKYKLGITDLKEVLKREPQNRIASNTLARLKKMGD